MYCCQENVFLLKLAPLKFIWLPRLLGSGWFAEARCLHAYLHGPQSTVITDQADSIRKPGAVWGMWEQCLSLRYLSAYGDLECNSLLNRKPAHSLSYNIFHHNIHIFQLTGGESSCSVTEGANLEQSELWQTGKNIMAIIQTHHDEWVNATLNCRLYRAKCERINLRMTSYM